MSNNVENLSWESGFITFDRADGPSVRIPINEIISAYLSGTQQAVVADNNAIGGVLVLHIVQMAAAALANNDITLTHKERVIDAWFVLGGAGVGSTTITIKNNTSAITDAMDASGSDKAIVRATTIDEANHEIAAGGTLRTQTETGATQPKATAYILCVRVA